MAKKSQIVKDVMLVNGQLTCSSPWFKPKCIISGYQSPNDPGYEQNSSFKLEEVKSDPHEEFLAGESISFRATDRRQRNGFAKYGGGEVRCYFRFG